MHIVEPTPSVRDWFAIEFSKRGFNITGVDISETFIKGLTSKIISEKLNIKVIQANILDVQLNEKFSGAVCLGNSFGYFNIDKMKVFIKRFLQALKAVQNLLLILEWLLKVFYQTF